MQKITQYLNTELSELPTNTKKRTIFLRVSPKLITHYRLLRSSTSTSFFLQYLAVKNKQTKK